MISDAYVLFICDECNGDQEVTLEVVYSDYTGTDPHADLRDKALERLLPQGWESSNGKHFCCVECKQSHKGN